jgi:5-methylcytosine-specific restriction endonuclease McrA
VEEWNDTQRAQYHRRRARKRNPDGRIEKFKMMEIAERDGYVCGICQESVDMTLLWPDPMSPSQDHIIPLFMGGEHIRSNVQLAHLVCNFKKGHSVDDGVALRTQAVPGAHHPSGDKATAPAAGDPSTGHLRGVRSPHAYSIPG